MITLLSVPFSLRHVSSHPPISVVVAVARPWRMGGISIRIRTREEAMDRWLFLEIGGFRGRARFGISTRAPTRPHVQRRGAQ